MAHFGVGTTLYEVGRYHDAYRHLRYYAQIAPAQAWNLVWYGKAAEAIGENSEALKAYDAAIELEKLSAQEESATDAAELLEALRQRMGEDDA
jgi:tetratricopeptide (TPR) repeat protein